MNECQGRNDDNVIIKSIGIKGHADQKKRAETDRTDS